MFILDDGTIIILFAMCHKIGSLQSSCTRMSHCAKALKRNAGHSTIGILSSFCSIHLE